MKLKKKTSFKRENILDLFIFELLRREKEARKRLLTHPVGLGYLISLYIQPSLLNCSLVEGPGAPIRVILGPSSTFLNRKKIKEVDYFCSFFLVSPSMPMSEKELKESILVCAISDRENPCRIGLINPSQTFGKEVGIQEYDEGIVNSELCSFRKFYNCDEIWRISIEELYEVTRKKLEAKFKNYEKRSEILYKTFEPMYRTYTNFFTQELEKLVKRMFGGKRGIYTT